MTELHCTERKKFDITSAAAVRVSAPLSFYEMQNTEEHGGRGKESDLTVILLASMIALL